MKHIVTFENSSWHIRAIVEHAMGRFYVRVESTRTKSTPLTHEYTSRRAAIIAALDIVGD